MTWGPGRHGPGNNLFIMFDDPAGNHVELSAEMEQFHDEQADHPVRHWRPVPRSINLWGAPPPSGRRARRPTWRRRTDDRPRRRAAGGQHRPARRRLDRRGRLPAQRGRARRPRDDAPRRRARRSLAVDHLHRAAHLLRPSRPRDPLAPHVRRLAPQGLRRPVALRRPRGRGRDPLRAHRLRRGGRALLRDLQAAARRGGHPGGHALPRRLSAHGERGPRVRQRAPRLRDHLARVQRRRSPRARAPRHGHPARGSRHPVGPRARDGDDREGRGFNFNDSELTSLPKDPMERYLDALSDLSPSVPEGAWLGLHVCYGSLQHEEGESPDSAHYTPIRDLGTAVEMLNRGVVACGRRVDFVHMPVQLPRTSATGTTRRSTASTSATPAYTSGCSTSATAWRARWSGSRSPGATSTTSVSGPRAAGVGAPRRRASRNCWRSTPRWPRRSPGIRPTGHVSPFMRASTLPSCAVRRSWPPSAPRPAIRRSSAA